MISALMNEKNIVPGTLKEGSDSDESLTISELRAQMADMQLEIEILKETINVIKKDPGVNLETLKNREKAVIIDAIRDRYSLPMLQNALHLSKSSYYYQEAAIKKEDKYTRNSEKPQQNNIRNPRFIFIMLNKMITKKSAANSR